MVGELLGSYRVLSVLGQGGIGVVYEGEHTVIHRRVAIKVLLPERTQSPEIVQRFFNEARAATLIHHPGIVEIIDFGTHRGGVAYIVMELLEGASLARHLAGGRSLPLELALPVLRQLANALGAAHRKGIVHRDLKPDNIFLIPDSDVIGGVRVKILDFGIAKLAQSDLLSPLHTRTGSIMGTPVYMSPEQCRGAGGVDHRTDIYSLGCVAYEMLCGRPPFHGDGMGDIIVAHISSPPAPPRSLERRIPPAVEQLVLRMLAKAPEARPQSMDEVVAALDAIAGAAPRSRAVTAPPLGPPTPSTLGGSASQLVSLPGRAAPRWRLPAVALVVAALGIAVAVLALRREPPETAAPVIASPDAASAPAATPPPVDAAAVSAPPLPSVDAAPPVPEKTIEPPRAPPPPRVKPPAPPAKPKPKPKTSPGDDPVDPFAS